MRCVNVAGSVGGGAGWISRFRVNYICRDTGPDCWTSGRRYITSIYGQTQPHLCRRQYRNLRKKTSLSLSKSLSSMICVSFSNVTT